MPIATLIVKIGADLAELRENAKKATDILGDMQGVVKKVGDLMATYFTGRAILGAVQAVMDFAGQMTDLSARTGMSTEALQLFKFAGEQVGVSLDTVVGAVTQLQNRLAGGDKSALAALKDLGVGFDDIRSKAPDQQMAMIADAIAKIPDPAERTRVAMDLMGRGAAEIMPLLLSNFGEMAAKARELGVVLDDETIAAMDDLGDKMTGLKGAGMAVVAELFIPFVPLLSEVANALMGVGHWVKDAQVAFEQLISLTAGGFAHTNKWTADLLEMINVGGVFDDEIKRIRENSESWAAVSNDLATTQTKVANATRSATAAAVENAEAQREAARHAKEIQQITDKLWGSDVIAKAKNYAEAIEDAGGKLPPMKDAQAEINKVMTEAIGIMEQTGQGATALAQRLDALRTQSLQPLAATHLDVSKMMAALPATITPESVPEILTQKLADDAAEYFTEQDKFYADLAKEIEGMTPKIEQPISASTERMTQKWHNLGAAAAAAIKLMVPEGFSFEDAYTKAGFIVHESISGLRPQSTMPGFQFGTGGYQDFGRGTPVMLHGWEKVTPRGAGGSEGLSVNVNVGTFVGSDRTAARQLADIVGDEMLRRVGNMRKLTGS